MRRRRDCGGPTFSLEHLSASGKTAFSNATQLSRFDKDRVWTYGCRWFLSLILALLVRSCWALVCFSSCLWIVKALYPSWLVGGELSETSSLGVCDSGLSDKTSGGSSEGILADGLDSLDLGQELRQFDRLIGFPGFPPQDQDRPRFPPKPPPKPNAQKVGREMIWL